MGAGASQGVVLVGFGGRGGAAGGGVAADELGEGGGVGGGGWVVFLSRCLRADLGAAKGTCRFGFDGWALWPAWVARASSSVQRTLRRRRAFGGGGACGL